MNGVSLQNDICMWVYKCVELDEYYRWSFSIFDFRIEIAGQVCILYQYSYREVHENFLCCFDDAI